MRTYAEGFKPKTDVRTQKARQGPVPAILTLQRTAGNAAVVELLAQRASSPNVVVQRTPEDVYTLIHSFQGRLKGKGPNDQPVIQILAEMKAFAWLHRADERTRTELATRALLMRKDWISDPTLTKQTKDQLWEVLTELGKGSPLTRDPAAPAPVAAPAAAANQGQAPAAANRGPAPVQAPAAAPAVVVLTKAMRAVDVLNHLAAQRASATKLQMRWYVTSLDKDGAYSTAYNLGANTNWEVHVHHDKRGRTTACTVQQAVAVGNTGATRGMPLDAAKLTNIGIPANHDPRELVAAKRWTALA